MNMEINGIPDGHVVVGHISYLKVLDAEGECYWAFRNDGLNSMEALGLAVDMENEVRMSVSDMKVDPGERDDS